MRQPRKTPAPWFEPLDKQGAVIEIWPNPGAASILFYPGSVLAPGHYALLLQALSVAGLGVAAIHFCGHGRGAKKSVFTFDGLLETCLAAEQWLLANIADQVVACGHSQGGILVLAHASHSNSLKYIFPICAAFPRMDASVTLTRFAPFANQRNVILKVINCLAKTIPWLPVPLPLYLSGRALLAGKLEPLYMGRDKGRISYPLKFLATLFDADISPSLNCPFTLFTAKNDGLFSRSLALATFEAIKAPMKQLVWLEDGGHLAPFNPSLANYIARVISAQCSSMGLPISARLPRP